MYSKFSEFARVVFEIRECTDTHTDKIITTLRTDTSGRSVYPIWKKIYYVTHPAMH